MEKRENANKSDRDEKGRYLPEHNLAGPGRHELTESDRVKKKAIAELVKEYQENLAQALPLIEPVLIEKAKTGDIASIRELHDRVMGKALQKTDITSKGRAILVTAQEAIDRHEIPQDTINGVQGQE